jgi:hypothetical protein
MTEKEKAQLIAQLHGSLTTAAAALQKLDAELIARLAHHDHRAAEELAQLIEPWRSALLSEVGRVSRLEGWSATAAAAGHRL